MRLRHGVGLAIPAGSGSAPRQDGALAVSLRRHAPALIFLATMVGGGGLLLTRVMEEGPMHSLTLLITHLSDVALRGVGFAADHQEKWLFARDRSFGMKVENNCNGAWAHLVFLASVLAFPASWRQKFFGIAVGELLLFFLNIFRVMSLFVIGLYAPTLFRAAHVYVWQFLIIGLALLLFFIWVDRFVRRPA